MYRTLPLLALTTFLIAPRAASACGEGGGLGALGNGFAVVVGTTLMLLIASGSVMAVDHALPDDDDPEGRPPEEWTAQDSALGAGSALLGLAGGAAAGGLVGAVVGFAISGDGGAAGGLGSLGAITGAWVGTPLGVWAYGRRRGHRRRYMAAVTGTALGVLLAVALGDTEVAPLGFLAVPVTASLIYGSSSPTTQLKEVVATRERARSDELLVGLPPNLTSPVRW